MLSTFIQFSNIFHFHRLGGWVHIILLFNENQYEIRTVLSREKGHTLQAGKIEVCKPQVSIS
jgi:hypothetical protein